MCVGVCMFMYLHACMQGAYSCDALLWAKDKKIVCLALPNDSPVLLLLKIFFFFQI